MLSNIEAYHRPDTLQEAVSLLEEDPQNRVVLAGGTHLIPDRLSSYREVVDLQNLPFQGAEKDGERVHIGALTRISSLQKSIQWNRWNLGVLSEVAKDKPSQLIRNQATLGGELVRADARAELPVVLLALGARVQYRGPEGESVVPLENFYRGEGETVLQPADIVTAVDVPLPSSDDRIYYNRLSRTENDDSLISLACWFKDGQDVISDARVAAGGVDEHAVRLNQVEECIRRHSITNPEFRDELSEVLQSEVMPPSDFRASGRYRRTVLGVFLRRALNLDEGA